MTRAAIGLGANLGALDATFARALKALERHGRIAAVSPSYRSEPWGFADQPEFRNAVVLLDTMLPPRALLRALKGIEGELGRVASNRWGPRAIDLDILTYGNARVNDADLVIPHARLYERAFALAPLADVDARFAPALAALPEEARRAVQRIPAPAARNPLTVDWDLTLERVRSAAAFCADAGLSRFRIDEADLEIEVRRSPRPARPAAHAAVPEGAHANGIAASTNGSGTHDEIPATVVKAEFVGIVRLSRPAVVAGAVLAQDRELAYVESLGIRNPVRAGGAGRIAQVFVTDGEPVEYGQPLFAIEVSRT